jgi:protein tyrosine phosphatase
MYPMFSKVMVHHPNLGVKYLNVKIDDTEEYKISTHFKEVYEFIDSVLNENIQQEDSKLCKDFNRLGLNEHKSLTEYFSNISNWTFKNKIMQIVFKRFYCASKNDNRILIHCSMGISRSPTITTMYVMKKFELSFDEVFLVYQRHIIL